MALGRQTYSLNGFNHDSLKTSERGNNRKLVVMKEVLNSQNDGLTCTPRIWFGEDGYIERVLLANGEFADLSSTKKFKKAINSLIGTETEMIFKPVRTN